jgi:regulatory protein
VKVYTLEQAKRKMEHYCAYQERSHYQVEKKLREMRMIPEAIDRIILHLMHENFLVEERFAKAYVRGKYKIKHWGRQKIIQGLKQHYIHDNLIKSALDEIDEDEYQKIIIRLIEKKKNEYKTTNSYQLKQKISRFLLSKGFRYEEFSKLLK